MLKRVVVGLAASGILVAAGGLGAPTAHAASTPTGGGCEIGGTAKFTPGLKTASAKLRYTFSGALTNCKSNATKATAGTVTASGGGTTSCANGTTTGVATVKWNDGRTSVITYATTDVGALVNLTGTVTGGTETAFLHKAVNAVLAFQANPQQCTTAAGIASATFAGAGLFH